MGTAITLTAVCKEENNIELTLAVKIASAPLPLIAVITFSHNPHECVPHPDGSLYNVYDYSYTVDNFNVGKKMSQDVEALKAISDILPRLLKEHDPAGVLRDEEQTIQTAWAYYEVSGARSWEHFQQISNRSCGIGAEPAWFYA